LQNFLVFFQDF